MMIAKSIWPRSQMIKGDVSGAEKGFSTAKW